MWIPLGLLVKENFQLPCFGWTLNVCIVSIVLTSSTSLACGGSGGGRYVVDTGRGRGHNSSADNQTKGLNESSWTVPDLDEALVVNLTGIKDTVDRNVKSSWRGWEPPPAIRKEWKKWHDDLLKQNALLGEVPWKQKKGKGWSDEYGGSEELEGPGGQNYSSERGPGSHWPKLPGWAGLGEGIDGTPVPPWAYAPRNVGKPSLCYLPPIKGNCKNPEKGNRPLQRWGYNPYMDECQKYVWSGCGGTRNKFVTKKKCENHCARPPQPSCSANSGILDTSSRNKLG